MSSRLRKRIEALEQQIPQYFLIEKLAALEHQQWVEWSKELSEKEQLSEERQKRWQTLWVPYNELPENMKDHDRKWAKKVIAILLESLNYQT